MTKTKLTAWERAERYARMTDDFATMTAERDALREAVRVLAVELAASFDFDSGMPESLVCIPIEVFNNKLALAAVRKAGAT